VFGFANLPRMGLTPPVLRTLCQHYNEILFENHISAQTLLNMVGQRSIPSAELIPVSTLAEDFKCRISTENEKISGKISQDPLAAAMRMGPGPSPTADHRGAQALLRKGAGRGR
jgi:hypothetical protein